jgi:phenylacetate-coenzyme A ligase PaaK-like adenylate-forming protein
MIVTYPSFARRLAEEQEAGRLRIAPRRITTTAEALTQQVRDIVRGAWGAETLDSYGTTEAGLLGTECDAVAGMHIAEDMVVLEAVDDEDRPVAPGIRGSKVLLTTLFNRALPLIRYEISDIVTLDDRPCACRRPFARVTSIEGRREDYIGLRATGGGDVRVHAGRLRAPLAGVPGLRQFQLVPVFDHLRLRITVRDGARVDDVVAAAERTVRETLDGVGADVGVSTEVVDTIERVGSGAKERLVAAAG